MEIFIFTCDVAAIYLLLKRKHPNQAEASHGQAKASHKQCTSFVVGLFHIIVMYSSLSQCVTVSPAALQIMQLEAFLEWCS